VEGIVDADAVGNDEVLDIAGPVEFAAFEPQPLASTSAQASAAVFMRFEDRTTTSRVTCLR
jgi:hypothetical protein